LREHVEPSVNADHEIAPFTANSPAGPLTTAVLPLGVVDPVGDAGRRDRVRLGGWDVHGGHRIAVRIGQGQGDVAVRGDGRGQVGSDGFGVPGGGGSGRPAGVDPGRIIRIVVYRRVTAVVPAASMVVYTERRSADTNPDSLIA
jgi:hypothetical protein